MKIYSISDRWARPVIGGHPFIVLRRDNWDDYGYKTMFHAELWTGPDQHVDIGPLKLMAIDDVNADPTYTPLEDGLINLGDNYASLGQATSYYENLKEHLGPVELWSYLRGVRDIAGNPALVARFQEHGAFETSLLREGGARRALTDAPALLQDQEQDQALAFSFHTSVGGEAFVADFRFGDVEKIPSRMNAIIGYNGVGKTRLMANLSHVAWRDIRDRFEVAEKNGRLEPEHIPFGRVVAVSYSAFDTFELPRTRVGARGQYYYCGLRDATADEVAEPRGLKSVDVISREISDGLERLQTDERWRSLEAALAPLFREPSFQLSSTSIDFRDKNRPWQPVFERLSTGHKISLNIVVQLVAQLENKSLVLIDEPESHLHPPLLAALMKGVAAALEDTNSFAVVATHSPVVLQEVAARHVQILRRYEEKTVVERPDSETFGENVGLLTRTVFNLDNAESDHEGTLRELGVTRGADGLGDIFPDGLSSQALAIVMQAEAEAAQDDLGDV